MGWEKSKYRPRSPGNLVYKKSRNLNFVICRNIMETVKETSVEVVSLKISFYLQKISSKAKTTAQVTKSSL